MRARGFKLAQFWIHPADFEQVSKLVAKLRRKREK
jgi:hypothetical protein